MEIIIIIQVILSLLAEHGWASHYAPGMMQHQVAYHQLVEPCDGCAVASVGCDHIGEYWHIRLHDTIIPVVVADCAGDVETVQWMETNNIILELSYELALAADCVGGGCRVEVWR